MRMTEVSTCSDLYFSYGFIKLSIHGFVLRQVSLNYDPRSYFLKSRIFGDLYEFFLLFLGIYDFYEKSLIPKMASFSIIKILGILE